mmetsp:Transcript_9654/g.11554  ORF Transcript_9654/g.11554 Transcript_9654/m.11554 type:complete len:170 (+) Transcript_9654:78-587(+)|eukprot:CAMPEP_0195300876 /NCGR_PEP_ID=MMETSP0707-20130614/28334_1 /TAXON_ID=33640 /ORGANISM="Asterionellopsis glacialis, Strain CCMP134" /LENGTH=169 /DNA_ID=CAMNT_0040363695 /DNA_START=87 /DNA_END=596 /DNA_ORIENTATION=+
MHHRPGWVNGAAIAVSATAVTASTIWICSTLSKYGLDGTLRYIWVGDPLSPEVRQSVSTLEKVESKIPKLEKLLMQIEEALSKARLDSIDDEKWIVVPQWIVSYAPKNLEKDITKLDTSLDRLAAEVDAIASHDNAEVKLLKKEYSQRIVQLMGRTDALLAIYAQQDTS